MPRPHALIVFAAALIGGCATHSDRLQDIRSAYHSGNTEGAKTKIDAAIAKLGIVVAGIDHDDAARHVRKQPPRKLGDGILWDRDDDDFPGFGRAPSYWRCDQRLSGTDELITSWGAAVNQWYKDEDWIPQLIQARLPEDVEISHSDGRWRAVPVAP